MAEDAAWSDIEPLLNQSLSSLKPVERECVLLRFFQGLSFAVAGEALGLSEEAARKRVSRSLEKMQRFLTREGVVIAGAGLAALLLSRAAEAAPASCQAGVVALTVGTLAGYVNAGLTGSHAYQIMEGTLKAMRAVQLKTAAGFTTATVIGLTTYAVAKGVPIVKHNHPTYPLVASSKLGHALELAPGKTLTAAQIVVHCREAYAVLQTYQGATKVTTMTVAKGASREEHTSANILFVRPGKIRVDGTYSRGRPFAYLSDGTATVERDDANPWKKAESTQLAIAAVTGTSRNAATTIPWLLLGMRDILFTPSLSPEVREDEVDGHPCYVVTNFMAMDPLNVTRSYWLDEKTFLLRRCAWDSDNAATSIQIAGKKLNVPAIKAHKEQRFTNERLNETVPDSTFTLPATQ